MARLNCPGNHDYISMKVKVIAGFGLAYISKNGQTVYEEPRGLEFQDSWDRLQRS